MSKTPWLVQAVDARKALLEEEAARRQGHMQWCQVAKRDQEIKAAHRRAVLLQDHADTHAAALASGLFNGTPFILACPHFWPGHGEVQSLEWRLCRCGRKVPNWAAHRQQHGRCRFTFRQHTRAWLAAERRAQRLRPRLPHEGLHRGRQPQTARRGGAAAPVPRNRAA